jgi:hypothetical protein
VLRPKGDLHSPHTGRLRITTAPTDIRAVIAASAAAGGRDVAVKVDVAPEVPATVDVDSLRVRQVGARGAVVRGVVCRCRLRWLVSVPGRVCV